MAYQIQNYLGEVVVEHVTAEELEGLKEQSLAEGLNYFLTDTDLLERLAQDVEASSRARIIVPISE